MASNTPTTYVALLRGINVGGNTPVSMAELKAQFEDLGFQDVKTYINSGNVIFRSPATNPRELESTIEKRLDEHFHYDIRVVVHSLTEIETLLNSIPASWASPADKKCNVIFLRHTIDTPDTLSNFTPKPDIEELYYHPGVLFWSAQTSSLTRSSMLKVSASPLYQDMTVRIYNTVKKILAIMQQTDQLQ